MVTSVFNMLHLIRLKEKYFLNSNLQCRYSSLLRSIENYWTICEHCSSPYAAQPEGSLSCRIYLNSIYKHVDSICISVNVELQIRSCQRIEQSHTDIAFFFITSLNVYKKRHIHIKILAKTNM